MDPGKSMEEMSSVQPLALSALTRQIQQVLLETFSQKDFWVLADVTNHTYYAQKDQHYFDLVEKDKNSGTILAKVSAAAWGRAVESIRFFEEITGQVFKNDIHVLVRVSVSYHAVYGLRLSLLEIDPNFTIGKLEQQKQAILIRLLTECSDFIRKSGDKYITHNNQLPLPPVIQHVAVIGSANSAGYQDFMHTLENNSYGYQFKVDNYFTVVQGENKAELIFQKLLDAFNSGVKYDAVIIIRGGGAQTDFLIFDTFLLGKITAKYPIPIITGIGHQKNETVVDLMAHSPTKTPTKAAEFILSHNRNFELQVLNVRQNMLIKSQQLLASHSQQMNNLHATIVNKSRNLLHSNQASTELLRQQLMNKTMLFLSGENAQLDFLWLSVKAGNKNFIRQKKQEIEHFNTVIRLVRPENILKRGFALVYKDNSILTSATGIRAGEQLRVKMTDAALQVTVNDKIIRNEKGA